MDIKKVSYDCWLDELVELYDTLENDKWVVESKKMPESRYVQILARINSLSNLVEEYESAQLRFEQNTDAVVSVYSDLEDDDTYFVDDDNPIEE